MQITIPRMRNWLRLPRQASVSTTQHSREYNSSVTPGASAHEARAYAATHLRLYSPWAVALPLTAREATDPGRWPSRHRFARLFGVVRLARTGASPDRLTFVRSERNAHSAGALFVLPIRRQSRRPRVPGPCRREYRRRAQVNRLVPPGQSSHPACRPAAGPRYATRLSPAVRIELERSLATFPVGNGSVKVDRVPAWRPTDDVVVSTSAACRGRVVRRSSAPFLPRPART